ncbi:MAG: amidohydrolase, partial [Flavobacteriaceae bacterium]|nr:amidohydrolase [Flavobacteriaceae bacterium]
MKLRIGVLLFFLVNLSFAQEYFPKNDGVKTPEKSVTAFTNAKIYVSPTQIIDNGTLLIKNGKVAGVGKNVSIPTDATKIDLNGKSIYPSFIDVYSGFGVKTPKRQGGGRSPQYHASRSGYYWNDHVRPETNATEKFEYDQKSATALLKAGFGVINTHHQDAIARGTGTLVALNQSGNTSNRILDDKSGQYFSFRKSALSRQSYPSSIMGGMALMRQMYSDADWYSKGNIESKDLSLEALNNNKGEVQIIEAGSWLNDIRADKVGDEFGVQYTIVGGGDEYQRIQEIKNTNATYILPLNFPKAYDVENTFNASKVSLGDMKHWNQAPGNLKAFSDQNIPFALTLHKLKSPGDFKSKIQKAIEYGLDKTKALEALTTVPASILGKKDIGNLNKGSIANFMITSGDVFGKKTKLYEHWIQGQKNVFENMNIKDIDGDYSLNFGGKSYDITIKGSTKKPSIEIKRDSTKLKGKISYGDDWINIHFAEKDKNEYARLMGKVSKSNKNLEGNATLPNGNESSWFASRKASEKESGDQGNGKKEGKENSNPT